MHDARGSLLLVVAPLDLAAFGRGGIAGVAKVGGISLVAQQRITNVFAGPRELVEGAEPKVRGWSTGITGRSSPAIFRDQAAPESGAYHNMFGSGDGNRFGVSTPRIRLAVFDDQARGRTLFCDSDCSLPGRHRFVAPAMPATVWERGMTRPASGSHIAP